VIIPDGSSVVAGTTNVYPNNVGISASGNGFINTDNLNLVSTSPIQQTVNVVLGADGSTGSSFTVGVANLGDGKLTITGPGYAKIGQVTGTDGSTVQVSGGTTVSGNIPNLQITTGGGSYESKAQINDTFHGNNVTGGNLVINHGGDFHSDSGTISSVTTVSGGNVTVTPTVAFTTSLELANGSLTVLISDAKTAPHIELFQACTENATIYIQVPLSDVKKIASSDLHTGVAVTYGTQTKPTDFKCKVILVDNNGNQFPLTTVVSVSGSRRLLNTGSCNQATFGSTQATYQTCSSTSAASRSAVSLVTLIGVLMISLFWRY